jgi:hypothetical protein
VASAVSSISTRTSKTNQAPKRKARTNEMQTKISKAPTASLQLPLKSKRLNSQYSGHHLSHFLCSQTYQILNHSSLWPRLRFQTISILEIHPYRSQSFFNEASLHTSELLPLVLESDPCGHCLALARDCRHILLVLRISILLHFSPHRLP